MRIMRTCILFLLCVCLLLSQAGIARAAEILDTGNCEDGVTWTLYEDRTLIFEGSGSITRSSFPNYDVEKVVLSDGITTIGQGAFSWLYLMTEIQLNEGLQTIGQQAFDGCEELQQITIPSTVTSIDYRAFSQCPKLEKIIFLGARPDVNRYAFYNGDDTTKPITVYYPDDGSWQQSDMNWWNGVTTWIPYTLDANGQMVPDESLAKVVDTQTRGNFSSGGSWWIEDDILHIGDADMISPDRDVDYTPLWGHIKGLVVEKGVKNFFGKLVGYEHLTSVTFPDSYSMGGSFANCPALETVDLGRGMESISADMFRGCSSLKEITLPASLKFGIDSQAFADCSGLMEITVPPGVTYINESAFRGCNQLTEVTFLGAPPKIEDGAFGPAAEAESELPPLTIYYPDDGSWTEEDMLYHYRTTTYIPYTVGANGEQIPDESRATVVAPLTSGTFPDGGSWRIENDILYIGGGAEIQPDLTFDYKAFWGNIKALVVEAGVAHLNYEFAEYEHLASVTFPDSYRRGSLFTNCNALTKVDLGKGIEETTKRMFTECNGLKEITIPTSVRLLGSNAVSSTNLETVTFLGSAPEYDADYLPFLGGDGKVRFYYPANDPSWTEEIMKTICGTPSIWTPYTLDAQGNMVPDESQSKAFEVIVARHYSSGRIFTLYTDGTVTVEGTGYISDIPSNWWKYLTHIEIAEGITDVNLRIAIPHDKPVTISLPTTVTKLGLGINNVKTLDLSYVTEFYEADLPQYFVDGIQCPDLESVILSDRLTMITDEAFSGCPKLKSIVIPDSVTIIGFDAFRNCKELESVKFGKNLESIYDNAFDGCEKLTEIELPSSLKNIGSEAFSRSGLREVVLPDGMTGLGNGVFSECGELVSAVLPEGITVVPPNCFDNCKKLEHVTIPDSAESIYEYAFYMCESLKSLDMNNVSYWENNAFSYTCIEHLVLGKTLDAVGEMAFMGWDTLKSVVIPSGSIQTWAFYGCENLESVTLGDDAANICNYAFQNCYKLKSIDLNCITSMYPYALSGCGPEGEGPEHIVFSKNLKEIPKECCSGNSNLKSIVIPEGVEKIEESVFAYADNLESVVLPDSLTEIGVKAFYLCKNLENVTFGKGLTMVDQEAFAYCEKLKEAVFQENLITIGQGAFYDTGIEKLEFCEGVTSIGYPPDFEYGYSSLYQSMLPTFGYCRNLKKVVPSEGLEYIPDGCFQNCAKLESVVISDSIRKIGKQAFQYCDALKDVTFGEGLEEIGHQAFFRLPNLESAIMQDKVTEIGYEAFAECPKLTKVRFSKALAFLGDGAFAFSGIKEAILPESLQELAYEKSPNAPDGIGTFAYCTNLKKVVFSGKPYLLEIPANCFRMCENLTEMELPDPIFYLRDHALDGVGLTGTLVLHGVKEIGDECFAHTKFTQLIFTGYAPEVIGNDVFYCGSSKVCYYPAMWRSMYESRDYFDNMPWVPYTTDKKGNFVLDEKLPTEAEIQEKIAQARKLYPEGYPCDKYSVSVLNSTALTGYGSQAFAYIISDMIFGEFPPEADADVSFSEVKVGDILRLDKDSRAVVVIEKSSKDVTVVQGDWNGTVHWDEKLTKKQVEAADYRITRYGKKILNDLSAVPNYKAQFPKLPTDVPTEEQVYERISAMASSFPEGFPFNLEIRYSTRGEAGEIGISDQGSACSAFAFMASDIAFGTAPIREVTNIKFEEIMVGDILHYDPDPNDTTTHVVVVWKVYKDRIVTVEGNYNEAVHWGSTFTKTEVEKMIARYTRYPEGTVAGTRGNAPTSIKKLKPSLSHSSDSATGKPVLKWKAVEGAVLYHVYRSTSKDGYFEPVATVMGTEYTDMSAVAGKKYYYKITAEAGGIQSKDSDIVCRYCDLPRPVVEESNDSTTGKIKLKWDKIDGAKEYKIYRRVGKSGDYKYYKTTTSNSYTDKSTTPGKVYYYKVLAVHSKDSANSAKSSGVGQTCKLARPVVDESNVSSSGKIKLEWKKIDGAKEYKIYRRVGKSGDYEYYKTTTSNSYTDKSTTPSTVYYYKVLAVHSNSSANSAKSSGVGQTCKLARPDVSIKLSSGNPKLTWEKIEGATKYEVYRATSKSGTYKLVKTTTSLKYTDKSVTAGKTYYYKVKAIHSKSSANSAHSSIDSIKAN